MKAKAKPPAAPSENPWRLPPAVGGGLLAGWAILILALFLDRSATPWNYAGPMLDQWAAMRLFHGYGLKCLFGFAAAAWIVWAACALGAWCIHQAAPEARLLAFERIAWGGALGFGLLANAVLILGALRLWYPAVFAGLLTALTLFLIFQRRSRPPADPAPVPALPWMGIWLIALALLGGLLLIGSLAPEIFFDSLHYHLAVPNLYRISHRLFSVSTSLYSNFAMTIQMVYGLAITIGNTLSAKLVHALVGGLLALGFIAFGQRHLSPGSGILATLFFFGMPMIGYNLTTAGTDVAWSALQFAAAAVLVRALLGPGRRFLRLAGALTGIAASCKYPAFPFIPIAGVLILWRRRGDERLSWKASLLDLAHFLGPALLFVAPVLIKNAAFHGNPLYPFGGTFWGTPPIDPKDWQSFVADTNPRSLAALFQDPSNFFRFIAHPWFMTINRDSSSELIGPLYLIGLPLLFLLRHPNPAFRLMRRYAMMIWLLWLFTSTVPRYGAPALALAAPLLADAALRAARAPWVRVPVMGALAIGSARNLYFLFFLLYNIGGWAVVGGLEAEDAYLGRMHATYPLPPYDAIRWMNGHLPAGSKILFAGESRSYYTRHATVMHSIPGRQPIVDWPRQAGDSEALARRLRREGVTHLFLNLGEGIRNAAYGIFAWDPRGWAVLNDFWSRYMKLAWKEEDPNPREPKELYVYEILSEAQAAQPHEAPPNPFARWRPQ